MRFLRFSLLVALGVLVAILPACGSSGSSSTSTAGAGSGVGGGGGASGLIFPGVGSADAISPTGVVVSWPAATNQSGGGSAFVRYEVYRAFSANAVFNGQPIKTTGSGVTSFADNNVPPFTTVFYGVFAIDSAGNISKNGLVTSARTPSEYAAGSSTYASDIEPLWSSTTPSCLSCHDGGAAGGRLDLSSFDGVMAGVGTLANPDTFVVAYDGEGTWNEFLFRLTQNPAPHVTYFSNPGDILAFQMPMMAWADEGALEFPDETPPVFEFSKIQNAGKYGGEFLPAQFPKVRLFWFHADDPESLPPSGSTLGQLEYHVYAGRDSASIDWQNPVAVVMSPEKLAPPNDLIEVQFDWPDNAIVAVIRALDASGRSVVVPPPGDPNYLEQLKLRYRNMSVNEREITLTR